MNDEAPLPSDDHDTTLKPPQFMLRALMIGTTAVAMLLSVLLAIGAFWAAALLFLLLLVVLLLLMKKFRKKLLNSQSQFRMLLIKCLWFLINIK